MTDSDRVARVARLLMADQREALGHIEMKPWPMPERWHFLVGHSLEALGLAGRTFWRDRAYLTPFGIEVRNHIQKEPK